MSTKNIFFGIRGTPFGGKIVPHKTDPDKMIIKAKHPEVGPILAQAADIPVVETKKGGVYFLTVVPREEMVTNLGEVLFMVASGQVAIAVKEESPAPTFSSLDDASELDDDGEEGSEDGGLGC